MRTRILSLGLPVALAVAASFAALPSLTHAQVQAQGQAQAQSQAQAPAQAQPPAATAAEQKSRTPIPSDMYCAGLVTKHMPPQDTILITGEGSDTKITFSEGDYVYINKGADQGMKVNDEFYVIRPTSDPTLYPWFNWQESIMNAIGTLWEDEGRLRVVVVHPKVSVAVIENSCEYMQRGDVVLPFVEHAAPELKTTAFDHFAEPSGKPKAMIVTGKHFQSTYGNDDIIYVNLGEAQGVHVGDYFRVFRYQGTQQETAYQTRRMAFDVYGFGTVSKKYKWDNVPREVVGEGIVLRTSQNSSSVLVTFALRELFAGDYVELE
jgi:hypothetical protein